MRLQDLEGRYRSPETTEPGMRYALELAGERFTLVAEAWSLTGRESPGTDRLEVRLLGRRQLRGSCRLHDGAVLLDATLLVDTPGEAPSGDAPGETRRQVAERIAVEIVPGSSPSLHLQLHGSLVTLSKLKFPRFSGS